MDISPELLDSQNGLSMQKMRLETDWARIRGSMMSVLAFNALGKSLWGNIIDVRGINCVLIQGFEG